MTEHRTEADALCKSADMLHDQGRYLEAIATYRQAIERAPDYFPSYNNLAVTLNLCGYYAEALTASELALLCAPHSAEAWANKGIALKSLGRLAEAETAFRQSLTLRPHQAATHSSLAGLLLDMGRQQEAVDAYRQALALNPKLHEARLKLTMLLPLPGASPEESFTDALDELEHHAKSDWAALGEVIGAAQPFALAYLPTDHTRALSRYGDIVCQARSAWFAPHSQQIHRAAPVRRDRIRLLIVSGQISNHSVWNVLLHGLLKHLDRTRFEVILYNTALHQAPEADLARTLVDNYRHGPQDWVQQALEDRPEVIYYPELAMDPIAAQLATLRLAPLQLAGWGHPITTGLPTIDIFISGELIEPPEAAQHYRERLIRLSGTGACSVLPHIAADASVRDRLDIPTDRTITHFLICQLAAKLNPAFDHLYPRIAQAHPASWFWFVRDNQTSWATSNLETRLCQAFEGHGLSPQQHLRFIDWLPAEQFLGLLDCMDIYLDTPAFSGYTTAWQALHRGLPIITLEGRFMRQRLAAGLLRQIGMPDTIATDTEDYIHKATHLAKHPLLREKISEQLINAAPLMDENIRAVRDFETTILNNIAISS